MAFPEVRTRTVISIVIIIAGIMVGGCFLLFGVTNLFYPDVPDVYLTRNTKICVLVCIIGVIFLWLSITALRGILSKQKRTKGEHKA